MAIDDQAASRVRTKRCMPCGVLGDQVVGPDPSVIGATEIPGPQTKSWMLIENSWTWNMSEKNSLEGHIMLEILFRIFWVVTV